MYLIQMGPVVYERRGGGTFTLVEAMREVYGVADTRILRTDGTVVVRRAGSSYAVEYAPRGITLRRRPRRKSHGTGRGTLNWLTGEVRWAPMRPAGTLAAAEEVAA